MQAAVGVHWGLWKIVAADGGGAGGLHSFSRRGWAAVPVWEHGIDRFDHAVESRIEARDLSPLRWPAL